MRKLLWAAVILIFVFMVFAKQIAFFSGELLWFLETGYISAWLKIIQAKFIMALFFGFSSFILVGLNLCLALKFRPKTTYNFSNKILEFHLPTNIEGFLKRIFFWGLAAFSILIAAEALSRWELFLYFLNSSGFGLTDPLFNKDISFYVFKLPFLKYFYSWLTFVFYLSLLLCAGIYFMYKGVQYVFKELYFTPKVRAHLFVLISIILAIKAFGYYLASYGLLFSSRGIVFGATFTDVHAQLPVFKILAFLSLLLSLLALANIFIKNWRWLAGGIMALVLISFLGSGIYAGLIQKFIVMPNELEKEKPYINFNVEYTRRAFNLDKIEERDFIASDDLSVADIKNNDATIRNIRLWDYAPLLKTYGQLQEIRTYYEFVDVDNDRYTVNGSYIQTMLSPRELAYSQLPSRIWINEHLTYTHGYGACMGPVNKVTKEGLPEFFIKDIPPVFFTGIKISRPEIYYGEMPNEYCLVNTKSREFDYPAGEKNVYCSYGGKGGVKINSLFKKLLFAIKFSEFKIFFSTDTTKDSRIMYYRRVNDRIRKITPLVYYEKEPYMAISSDGRLYWLCDGFTRSSYYPYSQPHGEAGNYIRNSVKAVVDAYSGDMSFYIADIEDPIIQAQSRIFPGLFKPLSEMPLDLRKHIRYPATYLSIQADMYAIYHMVDEQVFYNKEDLWKIPRRVIGGEEREMEPYYTILRFPNAKDEEFILMTPFTPAMKNNMIAWMAARCDEPYYGKLLVYKFPKEKLIYGPAQVEARIDQDTEISKQLTLWSQAGSTVIRGSLLVIPIEDSLIYVEPLYLAAEKAQMPELKRIIVAYKDKIAMEPTLEDSLGKIFSMDMSPAPVETKEIKSGERKPVLQELIDKAVNYLGLARTALKEGKWSKFGESLDKLEETLNKLKEIATE